MNFFTQNKNIIIGIVVVIAIVLIIYFSGKKAGKKYVPNEVQLPPDINPGTTSNYNPGSDTDLLYNDITGYNFGLRNADTLKYINTLSNSKIVAIHNDWNQRYFNEVGQKKIYQRLGEETVHFFNYEWVAAREILLNRLASLGCA